MSQTIIYGIKNCDTMKKAFKWLDGHGVDYQFHDYKKSGIDPNKLQQWCEKVGYEVLVNTRGTTWRKLDESQKTALDQTRAVALMAQNTSLIKRPVIEQGSILLVGYNEALFQEDLT